MIIKHTALDSHIVGVEHAGARTHYEFGPEETLEVPSEDAAQVLAVACFEEVKEDKIPDKPSEVTCPDCEKTFKSPQALTAHSQVHKKEPSEETTKTPPDA